MKGMTAFVCISDIDLDIIEESMSLFSRAKGTFVRRQRTESPLARFFGSGWGVAIICAVVSLSVLSAIVWAGWRDPVVPPLDTVGSDGLTESEEDQETGDETETDTEMETEAETQPTPTVDVWKGEVATNFGGGRGTKSDPYLIQSCAQLAYLAQKVNGGSKYTGKYFRLEADLNLNQRAWTPIGTYGKCFSGYFDGNGHSISGLVVSKPLRNQDYACAGLFGYVENGSLRGVWLNTPKVEIDLENKTTYAYIGALCGAYRCDGGSVDVSMEGCRVTDAVVTVRRGERVFAGGVIGYVVAYDGDDVTLRRVEGRVSSMKISDCWGVWTGGLAGYLDCRESGRIEIEDFCGYATISPIKSGNQYMGTIGAVAAPEGRITLRRGYGSVKVNGELVTSNSYMNSGYAMIGVVYNGATSKRYYFYDLFGELVAQNMTTTGLYYCDAAVESGIDHSSAYPKKGVLDEDIWDLSNSRKPAIKFP